MFGIVRKLFNTNQSKSLARSRLHFVLVQDRSGLTNQEMAEFKKEMVDVIKKFFIIDDNGVEIEYQRDSDATTLLINSPVLRRKATMNGSGKTPPKTGNDKKDGKVKQAAAV